MESERERERERAKTLKEQVTEWGREKTSERKEQSGIICMLNRTVLLVVDTNWREERKRKRERCNNQGSVCCVWCAPVTHLNVIMRMDEEGERERGEREREPIDQEPGWSNRRPPNLLIMREMCADLSVFHLSFSFSRSLHSLSISKHPLHEASFTLIWWHIYIKKLSSIVLVDVCISHILPSLTQQVKNKKSSQLDWNSMPSASDEG